MEDVRDSLIDRVLTMLEMENIAAALLHVYGLARSYGDSDASDGFLYYLEDARLMRRIRHVDSLKRDVSTAVEYYDDDKDSDPYAYDVETEDRISAIKLLIVNYLSGKYAGGIDTLLSRL